MNACLFLLCMLIFNVYMFFSFLPHLICFELFVIFPRDFLFDSRYSNTIRFVSTLPRSIRLAAASIFLFFLLFHTISLSSHPAHESNSAMYSSDQMNGAKTVFTSEAQSETDFPSAHPDHPDSTKVATDSFSENLHDMLNSCSSFTSSRDEIACLRAVLRSVIKNLSPGDEQISRSTQEMNMSPQGIDRKSVNEESIRLKIPPSSPHHPLSGIEDAAQNLRNILKTVAEAKISDLDSKPIQNRDGKLEYASTQVDEENDKIPVLGVTADGRIV